MAKTVSIDKNLTLFFTLHYPYNGGRSEKKHFAVVGIGGNLGDCIGRFEKLFTYFQNNCFVDIIKTSPILKNPPFGFLNQNYFFNSVIILKTNLSPVAFLKFLLKTEKKFKRQRSFKDAPRTLDLDLIFYDNIRFKSKNLTIPHPQWQNRNSVKIPLLFIEN